MIHRAVLLGKELTTDALELAALAWLRSAGREQADVYLCSYPKCGRTWLRFMISAYQLQLFKVDQPLTLANFAEVSPNLALGTRMGLRLRMPHADMVRLYGTHLPYGRLFQSARGIFLERDLRDVLVSYYHHRLARGQIAEGLDAFATSADGVGRAFRYLSSWHSALARLPAQNWCHLRYEQLLTDPTNGLRRCVEFLGLPLDEAALAYAVRVASAGNLRLLEEAHGSYDFSPEELRANPSARHIRKARAGTHRDELGPAATAHIEAKMNELRILR